MRPRILESKKIANLRGLYWTYGLRKTRYAPIVAGIKLTTIMSNRERRFNVDRRKFQYQIFKITRERESNEEIVNIRGCISSRGIIIKLNIHAHFPSNGNGKVYIIVGPLQFDIQGDNCVGVDRVYLIDKFTISDYMVRVEKESIQRIKTIIADAFDMCVMEAEKQQRRVFKERYNKIIEGDIVRIPYHGSPFIVDHFSPMGFAVLREVTANRLKSHPSRGA